MSNNDTKYYTLKDIEKITGRSYRSINRWVKKGQFPAYIKLFGGQSKNSPIIWEKTVVDSHLRGLRLTTMYVRPD